MFCSRQRIDSVFARTFGSKPKNKKQGPQPLLSRTLRREGLLARGALLLRLQILLAFGLGRDRLCLGVLGKLGALLGVVHNAIAFASDSFHRRQFVLMLLGHTLFHGGLFV